MNDLLVNVLGTIISGIFSLLAACIPYYLQRRKSASKIVQDISDQAIYNMWPWYFAYGVFLTLLFQFVIALLFTYGVTIGLLIVATQIDDVQNLTYDNRKSAAMYNSIKWVDLFISTTFNCIVILFVSKYCSHRFGKHALIKVIVAVFAVTAVWFICVLIVRDPVILNNSDVARFYAISLPLALFSAYVGHVWAKKSHTKFLVGYVCGRLAENDRLALLDLALTQRTPDEHQIKT